MIHIHTTSASRTNGYTKEPRREMMKIVHDRNVGAARVHVNGEPPEQVPRLELYNPFEQT